MVDFDRLFGAYRAACQELLSQQTPAGHWQGRLSSSALSTATAVSALSVIRGQLGRDESPPSVARQEELGELIFGGLRWLAAAQNADGGWGDTDRSLSNIATTMLVKAAFQLTCVPAKHAGLIERADRYIAKQGGVAGLRKRYGRDKTFAVPILTNCALAGLVPWKAVSPLPFELACFPQSWFRFLRLPVVSYAIPALVAIGQARYFHRPPRNPLVRWWRGRSAEKSLRVLEQMQPESGGFLEATPLTSFVVMSLASIGQARHPVTRRGLEFLVASVREDGSWPIDTNLATWVTTLSLNALAAGEPDAGMLRKEGGWGRSWPMKIAHSQIALPASDAPAVAIPGHRRGGAMEPNQSLGAALPQPPSFDECFITANRAQDAISKECVDWLLDCQCREEHPYTGAAPGGWGWSDLSGSVPDADDTSGALLALAAQLKANDQTASRNYEKYTRTAEAAAMGVRWLLDLQNSDGGWPTFCRGWGKLPFDRSGTDLTAHAIRALHAWRHFSDARVGQAIESGLAYLARQQRPDGSWSPLWFGNQHHPQEENPVYGTARVLLAYADLRKADDPAARRGLAWLAAGQRGDGAWGESPSVEETALALESLLAVGGADLYQRQIERGLAWLIDAVETDRFRQCSPIGFYFAKLWYYEALYPVIFTVAALGRAVRQFKPPPAECRLESAARLPEPTLVGATPAHLTHTM